MRGWTAFEQSHLYAKSNAGERGVSLPSTSDSGEIPDGTRIPPCLMFVNMYVREARHGESCTVRVRLESEVSDARVAQGFLDLHLVPAVEAWPAVLPASSVS